MSLLLLLAIAAGDVPAATPPGAADSQSAATTAPAAEPKKAEKKICKVDEAFTGSRLAKRICLTRSQWEQKERAEGRD